MRFSRTANGVEPNHKNVSPTTKHQHWKILYPRLAWDAMVNHPVTVKLWICTCICEIFVLSILFSEDVGLYLNYIPNHPFMHDSRTEVLYHFIGPKFLKHVVEKYNLTVCCIITLRRVGYIQFFVMLFQFVFIILWWRKDISKRYDMT